MIKVSVEVRSGTASFRVGVQAQSIRRALSVVGKRYPGSLVKVSFPIEPEGFFIEGPPPEARDSSRRRSGWRHESASKRSLLRSRGSEEV